MDHQGIQELEKQTEKLEREDLAFRMAEEAEQKQDIPTISFFMGVNVANILHSFELNSQ